MNLAMPVREDLRVANEAPADPDDLAAVVAQVRSTVPAITHVDYSARVQTVSAVTNPEFAQLIGAFADRTGCAVVLNTSFNSRDEPVVCTPADAYRTFRRTGLDLLVLEDCVVEREA
jgi:carbamoyltransferase